MAQEIRQFAILLPTGSTPSTPLVQAMSMPPRRVEELEILVPPGPRGEVGFAIGSSGVAIIPFPAGNWVITDNETINWPLESYLNSGGWEFRGYNTGTYPHTIYVRFLVSLTTSAPLDAGGPISVDQIQGPAPSPVLDLPQPPQLPDLPPLPQLPPPGQLDFPPAPAPPSASGPATTSTAPTGTAWDGVGFLTPDPLNDRLDELYVGQDGQCYWGVYGGGAGAFEGYAQGLGTIGSPAGAKDLVEVSGAYTLYQQQPRLNVRGVRKDGSRWVKVVNYLDYSTIEEWSSAASFPRERV